jgi:hypothetical protein
MRLWDGPWLHRLVDPKLLVEYRELADAGAPEPVLRRFAAEIYELDRMRQVIDAKERDAAERMRLEAERLGPKTTTARRMTDPVVELGWCACALCGTAWDPDYHGRTCPECVRATRETQPAPADEEYPVGSEIAYETFLVRGGLLGGHPGEEGSFGDEVWTHRAGGGGMRRIR